MLRCLLCLCLLAILGGCQAPWYRRSADRETYAVEREHENEALWPVANTSITPQLGSRLYDPFNPDYPPMPPDDPAAYFYMIHPANQPAPRTYHRDGDAPWIEDPSWREFLMLDKDGKVVLSQDGAVELGLLHSRDYQLALETLYTTALTLTLDRFDFDMHWYGTNNTSTGLYGANGLGFNTLTTANDLGFTRNLAAGGQLIIDFANSFVFTFSGVNGYAATSNASATLIQPLLRNAGRRIRLEALTQGERNLLYAVRSFARFREQFYVNLASGNGFLGLLSQVQNIRNFEADLMSQEQNLRLHEALYARGTVSTVQVDQAFQSYLQSRLNLIQSKSQLETSLDSYKQSLGLPPDLPVKLDDELLTPFQLASPNLEKLQGEVEKFYAEYRELDMAPPVPALKKGFSQMKEYNRRLLQVADEVADELKRWKGQPSANVNKEEEAQMKREHATRGALEKQMPELRAEMDKLAKDLDRDETDVTELTLVKSWEALQKRARELISEADQLFVIQTQVRVFLIQLQPITYTLEEASVQARDNRLDLMNQRAQVVDAWRQIEVTASALKAGLDVRLSANIATAPDSHNPVDFRAAASQYTVGLAFASPLNRLAERNAYRAALINYQQARRSFMALDDQIQAAVRSDIRQLELERSRFSIARQSLIAAARQVESARERLLVIPNAADTTGTQDVLNALNALLQAKSTLIGSWINYQTDRTQLLLDMDALRLTPGGLPENEPGDTNSVPRPAAQLGPPQWLPDNDPAPATPPAKQ